MNTDNTSAKIQILYWEDRR